MLLKCDLIDKNKQHKNRTNIVLIWTYWTVLEQKISLERVRFDLVENSLRTALIATVSKRQ